MAITKYIIDTMGGTVQLNSIPGKGKRISYHIGFGKSIYKRRRYGSSTMECISSR